MEVESKAELGMTDGEGAPSVGNSSKKFGYNVEKIGGR